MSPASSTVQWPKDLRGRSKQLMAAVSGPLREWAGRSEGCTPCRGDTLLRLGPGTNPVLGRRRPVNRMLGMGLHVQEKPSTALLGINSKVMNDPAIEMEEPQANGTPIGVCTDRIGRRMGMRADL
eukprot:15430169-Alexandrium_andersonii.AAC.2